LRPFYGTGIVGADVLNRNKIKGKTIIGMDAVGFWTSAAPLSGLLLFGLFLTVIRVGAQINIREFPAARGDFGDGGA